MDQAGQRRSHYIALSVQVPESLKDCKGLGLDVERWSRERLIDEIVAGRGYFEWFPLTELIGMAHQYGVGVYANNNRNDPIEVCARGRSSIGKPASTVLLLFNHYKEGRFPFVNEIGRPERIARLSKTYKVGRKSKDPAVYLQNLDRLMGSYPGGQVPMMSSPITRFRFTLIVTTILMRRSQTGRSPELASSCSSRLGRRAARTCSSSSLRV